MPRQTTIDLGAGVGGWPPKPSEFGAAGDAWQAEGWKVPVSFTALKASLRPKHHMKVLAPLLPEKYSPNRATGDGNQAAYLAAVPLAMAHALIQMLGPQWPPWG